MLVCHKNSAKSISLLAPPDLTSLVLALLAHPLRIRLRRMSRRCWVRISLSTRIAGLVGATAIQIRAFWSVAARFWIHLVLAELCLKGLALLFGIVALLAIGVDAAFRKVVRSAAGGY